MPPLLPGDRPSRMPAREIEIVDEMWNSMMADFASAGADIMDKDIMLIDNRNDSYRRPKDGILFVPRAPHQIRPPADTGVHYRLDEADQEFTLSLNDPPQLSDYQWNSVQLETEHNVCQACLDILNYYCRYAEARLTYQERSDNDRSQYMLSNSVIHHFNLFSLLAFATIQKCFLCQMLLNYLERRYGDKLTLVNFGSFRTEVCWKKNANLEEKDTLYFVLTNPSRTRDQWNFSHFFRMEVWPVHLLPRHFDLPARPENSEPSQLSVKHQTSTRSLTSQALAVSWLSQCRANGAGKHQECNKRDGNYLPTRLLDVKYAQETSQLRLVCPALDPALFTENREWMTLSHCWGAWGQKGDPILTKNNLEERQENGLRMADLPKTFQDSVEIAGWLDINWLWIDCLCIIQDSASDWIQEATMMSQIYQNAVLNVSADFGTDSRAGCFVEREQLDIVPLRIHSPQLSQSWDVLPATVHLFDWVGKAPSFSRAWIYRERQLSRRVLHFTDKELIWECCGVEGTSFASETLPGGAPSMHSSSNSDHKYQVGRLQQGLAESAEESYATWNDICEKLSEKYLTKPSDMPIVLSGLAKDFSHVLPTDEYVAGLWRSTLPQSLLWHTRDFKSDNLEYIAPSWSWLSTDGAVTLANRSRIMEKHPIANILRISTRLKYKDEYGPVESGTLEMEGILRRIQVSFGYETNVFKICVLDHEGGIDSDDEGNDERMRTIGSSWHEYYGDMCTIELDALLDGPNLDCFCMFTTIQQKGSHDSYREIACLLLKRIGEEGNTFTRIGTMVLGDLCALKMRYRLHMEVEEDDWKAIQNHIRVVQDQAIQDAKMQTEKRSEGQSEAVSEKGTGHPTLDVTQKHPQGPDALYQFDETLRPIHDFERLSPQTLAMV